MSVTTATWGRAASIASVISCIICFVPGLIAYGALQTDVHRNKESIESISRHQELLYQQVSETRSLVSELKATNKSLTEMLKLQHNLILNLQRTK